MSEQINKVLADRPQSFTTAQQAQARANIGAQASGDYVSSTTFTAYTATALSGLQADTAAISGVVSAISSTYIPQSSSGMYMPSGYYVSASTFDDYTSQVESGKLDASASSMFQPSGNYQPSGDYAYNSSISSKQDKSAMSAYVPFSAVSADSDSAITSINGSSVGKFTGITTGANLSGNGTSGSPLGLASSILLSSNGTSAVLGTGGLNLVTTTASAMATYGRGEMIVRQKTGSLDYQAEYGMFSGSGFWYSHGNSDWDALSGNWKSLSLKTWDGMNSASSRFDASSLQLLDDSGNVHVVDSASIDRWNSGSWNESANSLGTGFGGARAVSASQYNYGGAYDNWACREIYGDGVPAHQMYGFQVIPGDSAKNYYVKGNGTFVPVQQQTYFCEPYHVTGTGREYLGSSFYPTGLTANARLDFVNLCSAKTANIVINTYHGTTADIDPNISATMWYVASGNFWTDGTMDVPV